MRLFPAPIVLLALHYFSATEHSLARRTEVDEVFAPVGEEGTKAAQPAAQHAQTGAVQPSAHAGLEYQLSPDRFSAGWAVDFHRDNSPYGRQSS